MTEIPMHRENAKPVSFLWTLKLILGGLSWTTLMCSRFLVMLGQEENRLCYFWTGWDSVVLLAGIPLAGIGLAAIWAVVARMASNRWNRWLRGLAVFLTGLALVQLLPVQKAGWLAWTVFGLFFCGGVAAIRKKSWVWEWNAIVLLSLSSMYLLFLWQACHWESFAEAGGANGKFRETSPSKPDAPSVLLVLYDSVGAEDLFDSGRGWKDAYPAFAAFGKECVTFADAQSPGQHTGLSIPGLLLQRPMSENEPVPWRYWRNADQSDSWVLRAKQAGGTCALIGAYIPWGMLLRERPDFMDVRAYNGMWRLSGRWGCALRDVWLAADAVCAPWGRFWDIVPKVRWWAGLADIYYRHRCKQDQWATFRKLSEEGPATGQTILFHSNLTHDSDYLEDGTLAPTRGTPESELTYVDREFGLWMSEMKKRGKWDASWVILTADHSKGQGRRHRNVPFAVKTPGGIEGGSRVEGRLDLWNMTPFLKSLYDGESPSNSISVLMSLPQNP